MKRTPLKRRHKRQIDRQASEAWAKHARAKTCALCRSAAVEGHHVITQQALRQNAQANGYEFERVRWDFRNCLPLCRRHHEAHHNASHRLSLRVVRKACPKIDQFAREVGLAWFLERTYKP
jgi:hypothetical protein